AAAGAGRAGAARRGVALRPHGRSRAHHPHRSGQPGRVRRVVRQDALEDRMVEATVDDMNPELYPFVLERLTAAGATDAWIVPVIGKSGRPAQVIQVLAPPHAEEAVRDTR